MVAISARVIDSLELYEKIAPIYDDIAEISGSFPSPTLIHDLLSAHLSGHRTVVDVGIGTGASSRPFAERGFHITGVDGSRPMLALCGKKKIAAELLQADFTKAALPLPSEGFDVAFCANTLYLLPPVAQRHVIDELHRVTKPGGLYAFNYEPLKPGDMMVRFNDATTEMSDPCAVATRYLDPAIVSARLAAHGSEILAVDRRQVARKPDGQRIIFDTAICRKL